MNLNPIRANMTELELDGGTRVLFSYETPVAVFLVGTGIIKTTKKWSRTTSRHISQWAKEYSAYVTVSEKPQEYFDNLVAGVK